MDNTVVAFDMDRCHIELNYPYALVHTPLNKIKKLFDLMCRQHWRNTEAIKKTDEHIKLCIEQAEADTKVAVKSYTDGYKDTKFAYTLTAREKQRIERENKRLYNNAVSKKKAIDRMKKVQATFYEIKDKYEIKE